MCAHTGRLTIGCLQPGQTGTGRFVRRAGAAVNQKVNIVNLELRGAAYENRLTKYASRGFAVGVPGLDVNDLIDDAYFKV